MLHARKPPSGFEEFETDEGQVRLVTPKGLKLPSKDVLMAGLYFSATKALGTLFEAGEPLAAQLRMDFGAAGEIAVNVLLEQIVFVEI